MFAVLLFSDWSKVRPILPFTVASCAMALITNSSSYFSSGLAISVGLRLMKSVNLISFPAACFNDMS